MREVKLPSGAMLKVNAAPFTESKALYKAILAEAKSVEFSSKVDMSQVFKDLFCAGFSSDKIEACLWVCMRRCQYGDLKVEESTFEPLSAREDYTTVCIEVAKENILPFVKSLSAGYNQLLEATNSVPA